MSQPKSNRKFKDRGRVNFMRLGSRKKYYSKYKAELTEREKQLEQEKKDATKNEQ